MRRGKLIWIESDVGDAPDRFANYLHDLQLPVRCHPMAKSGNADRGHDSGVIDDEYANTENVDVCYQTLIDGEAQ
jgi:hypothetical protein